MLTHESSFNAGQLRQEAGTVRARFVGGELSVVTLLGGDSTVTEALSDNFIPVEVSGGWAANELLRVRCSGLTADGLACEAA